MKDVLDKVKAWAKRNARDLVRLAAVFVALALVAWQVRSVSDWLMACAAWLFVEFVLGSIKRQEA
jgi:uncharacterized MAPEG superfamily protein